MRVLVRLFRYAVMHKGVLALAFLLALLGAAVDIAKPWPGKLVIDYGLDGQPLPARLAAITTFLPGAGTRQGFLAWSVGAALAMVWVGAAVSFQVLSLIVRVCQRMVYDISMDLFNKVQRLSISYHGRKSVGDLLQRLSGDVFVIHTAVSQIALPATTSGITLGGMLVVMAKLNWQLSLIAFAAVPLLIAALAIFLRPMDATSSRQFRVQGSVMTLIEQSLTAIRAIQGFAREDYMSLKVSGKARELAGAYGVATAVSSAYQQVTTVIVGTAAAAILWFGSGQVLAHKLSVGGLWVFLGYLGALYGPVNLLALAVAAAVQVVARGRRVFEVLDADEEVPESKRAHDLGRSRGEITFRNVSFAYPGRHKPVLDEVSFSAGPGVITAIVGSTGVGKTSLVSLISRFHDPQQGEVLLDGHDVRNLTLRSLRDNVSLVLQEPFLFAMSVAENVAFGKPDCTQSDIVAAATAARAHDFIINLPHGYETLLGERGVTLSGGECQRLSIARALLKDAPILILDEPTSSLDAHTESQIFDALTEVMRNKTVIIISHRLNTIRRADQILVLDNGKIVERGTHETLIRNGQLYAELFRAQHIAAL
jgi:ATP-binding cassette subfamily B protein